MTRDWTSHVLWAVAALALLTAVAITFTTLHQVGPQQERREGKRAVLAELRELDAQLAPYRQAYEQRAQQEGAPPVSAESLLASISNAPTPDDVRRSSRAIDAEWQVVRRTFVFNRASLSDVMRCVVHAERADPPWNLVRFDIRALSNDDAGVAAITIELESLRRGR